MQVETVLPAGAMSWALGLVGAQSERFRRVTLSEADIAAISVPGGEMAYVGDGALLRLGVPLCHYTPALQYCRDFYGQTGKGDVLPKAISLGGLVRTLKALPASFTELACHPGLDGDVDSTYRWERAKMVKVLCDPRLRKILAAEGTELLSFAEIAGRGDLLRPAE
jgi:hypothetical protein